MLANAVVDVLGFTPATVDVLEGDWVDLIEGCVEVGEEREVVQLKKASEF